MDPRSALLALDPCYHGPEVKNLCEKSDQNALSTLFADFGQKDYFMLDQEILSTPIEFF